MGLRRMRFKLLAITLSSVIALLLIVQFWQFHTELKLESESKENTWWLTWNLVDPECERHNHVPSEKRFPAEFVIDSTDLYEKLDFGVKDGNKHFWNRTFEERYLRIRKTWSELPLEVIVVPHSHADTSWLKTYDEYYNFYVARILDNMVKFLNKTSDFTFIWSEMSFFARWFNTLDTDVKTTVVNLMKNRQLEITTGGWVMTDEATTHYWSIIDQLVEGNQWLKSATGMSPSYAWSVDVFGHSSAMQLLLSSAGFKGSVTVRTHYAMKAYLAKSLSLDFYWVQNVDDSRILCHMAPSDLYTIKHTCGPDPRVCLQYDFRKIQNEYSESIATDISVENIKPKAQRLLEQYGRFASLFPHNVLLVPLGDDFRYDRSIEWEQQYNNYNKLFKYINKNVKNAHVRFGTVADYFREVTQRLDRLGNRSLPLFQGDFFPYADIYVEGIPSYWTGFYNTRPFDKALARELEHWLRTAEILYSLARPTARKKNKKLLDSDYPYIMGSRHTLGLFQHHDAITGTSKREVTDDIRNRLHVAIEETMGIVTHAAQHIVMPNNSAKSPFTSRMYLDLTRTHPQALTSRIITSVPSTGRKIVLFNGLAYGRKEVVRIKLKSPYVAVLNKNGAKIPSQVNPVWNVTVGMLTNTYELLFVCDIDPLSFATYTIVRVPKESWDVSSKAKVSLLIGDQTPVHKPSSFFSFKPGIPPDIYVESPSITAKFTQSGLLKEMYIHRKHLWQKAKLDFFTYISTPHRSGAYLFNPTAEGPIPLNNMTDLIPMVRLVRGPLLSEVTFIQPFLSLTTTIYQYDDAPNYLDVAATFDISRMDPGIELIMRIETGINNDATFYTDSNGLEMLKRKHVKRLPLQGNIYPVVSAAYIEDKASRLNLLTAQSSGLAAPNSGTVELMLDRRLLYDDYRGLGEPVLDNRLTAAHFRLLLEPTPFSSQEYPSLTPSAYKSSLRMLYPLVTLIVDQEDTPVTEYHRSFATREWPLGTHLVNIRTLSSAEDYFKPSDYHLLTIVKQKLACDYTSTKDSAKKLDVKSLLFNIKTYSATSLTGIRGESTYVGPRTFETYNVSFNGG